MSPHNNLLMVFNFCNQMITADIPKASGKPPRPYVLLLGKNENAAVRPSITAFNSMCLFVQLSISYDNFYEIEFKPKYSFQ